MFKKKRKIIVFDITAIEDSLPVKELEKEGYIVIYVHGDPNRAVTVINV